MRTLTTAILPCAVKLAILVLIATAVGSCGENPLFPFLHGQQFDLRTVNGQPLPWSSGSGTQILEGWIRVVNDTLAERHEKRISGFVFDWTRPGRLTMHDDMIIVTYGPTCPSCGPGPELPVDTFTVSGAGLVRREGLPPDTIVRYYAHP